jgi:para-aminobenzoate synthetase component II
MRLRLIDCQDSFTWNLVDLFQRQAACVEVLSVQSSLSELLAPGPEAWILSPGPGRPADWPALHQFLERLATTTPLLGVCLGHQAIGEYFGARLQRDNPMHGESIIVDRTSGDLFNGLKPSFDAMRYNSLGLDPKSKPEALQWTAYGPAGEVMALAHRERPWFGVQFHPDSILTPCGEDIAVRFMEIVMTNRAGNGPLLDLDSHSLRP